MSSFNHLVGLISTISIITVAFNRLGKPPLNLVGFSQIFLVKVIQMTPQRMTMVMMMTMRMKMVKKMTKVHVFQIWSWL